MWKNFIHNGVFTLKKTVDFFFMYMFVCMFLFCVVFTVRYHVIRLSASILSHDSIAFGSLPAFRSSRQ